MDQYKNITKDEKLDELACIVKKIIDPVTLNWLTQRVLNFWPGQKKGIFPGAQPVSLEKSNFKKLCNSQYVVGEKTDGMRYFLLCTVIPMHNDKIIYGIFLVDRHFNFFLVLQHFTHKEVFTNETLLDGELCEGVFYVHDGICIGGENISEYDWSVRWKKIDNFLSKIWRSDITKNQFPIRLKKFYPFEHLSLLIKDKKELPFKSDGLVFYPQKEKVGYRTQFTLFKWKKQKDHTIDFKIRRARKSKKTSSTMYDLLTWDGTKDIIFSKTPHGSLNGKIIPRHSIVEYYYNLEEKLFYPLKIRFDKPKGNSKFTADKTMLNIRENITMEELVSLKN